AQVRVVTGCIRPMSGHPERGEACPLPAHRPGGREELDVLRVGAGPAAFDVGHPELVEHPRHAQLVGQREGDVLALRAVTQGRVVEDDRRVAHAATPAAASSASTTAVAKPVVPTTTSPSPGRAESPGWPARQPASMAAATAASTASAASARP